jgi:hypothetical protein
MRWMYDAAYPPDNPPLAYVVKNAKTRGGRWAADWSGVIGMAPGDDIVATQWISAVQLGTAYDASVIDGSVPLWRRPA